MAKAMATAMVGQADTAVEVAAAAPDMVLTGLVPVEATDSSQQEEKGKAQVDMPTAEQEMARTAAGARAALVTNEAETAAVPDIMQTSHRKLSEELLRVTARRVRVPT